MPLGCETGTSSIDPLIILVPVGIFVLPPLVLSVLLLTFWGKGIRPSRDLRLSEKRRAGEVMGLWKVRKDMNDTDEKSSSVLTDIWDMSMSTSSGWLATPSDSSVLAVILWCSFTGSAEALYVVPCILDESRYQKLVICEIRLANILGATIWSCRRSGLWIPLCRNALIVVRTKTMRKFCSFLLKSASSFEMRMRTK